jgi:hypothetical protein
MAMNNNTVDVYYNTNGEHGTQRNTTAKSYAKK